MEIKQKSFSQSVSVIGLGYMGLPVACLIAKAGYQTIGVDLNEEKVSLIQKGRMPFTEEGVDELLKSALENGFCAQTSVVSSDIYLIAVPTPHLDSKCDLKYVFSALESIVPVAKNNQLVIIESTISPKTCIKAQSFLESKGLNIEVVHCPERAIPGSTLRELVNNDRIIGAPSAESYRVAKKLYRSFVKGEIFPTNTTTAECVKLIENTFRDVNIAFANELAAIADELEIDVLEAISLANRHPRVNVLTPGPGVGGHCIPIDPWFLVENTNSGDLIRKARSVNDNRPLEIVKLVDHQTKLVAGQNIAILGVTYKPDVDDCRETPAEAILYGLKDKGYTVKYYDSHVDFWLCEKVNSLEAALKWADVSIIVSNHSEFRDRNFSEVVLNNCGKRI